MYIPSFIVGLGTGLTIALVVLLIAAFIVHRSEKRKS